jgi:hypothetical protein
MGARDHLTPEDFLLHLQETIKGFGEETSEHQLAMARMLWHGSSKLRRHAQFDGYVTFTHQELDALFGRRRFAAVNERVKLFEVTPNWYADRGLTRGYKLTDHAKKARDIYLTKAYRTTTRLLQGNGAVMRVLPEAVASKDMDGITATAWRRAKVLNKARVDLDALERLRCWVAGLRDDMIVGNVPPSLLASLPPLANIEFLHDATSQVLRMAKTDVAGNGYVMHRYVMSKSGRLYAKGINLQTAPVLVKQAALDGMWEYDFANCHFAIIDQMAQRFGYECKAIRRYLQHKKTTRAALAMKAGITEEDAKLCLLATMYGARATEWHGGAIVQTIGVEAARRLFEVPEFAAIKADIQGARRCILANWPRTANGRLTNAMGKAIVGTAKAEERLAHLTQGVEAAALKAALAEYPDDIVLLQHDGFAATCRLDVERIERAVFDATGYRLPLEEERIQMDADAYFMRSQAPKRAASENQGVTTT